MTTNIGPPIQPPWNSVATEGEGADIYECPPSIRGLLRNYPLRDDITEPLKIGRGSATAH